MTGKDQGEGTSEELFDLLSKWTASMPGYEPVVSEYVDHPENWHVPGSFIGSKYYEQLPRLAHSAIRMRDKVRKQVTHLYEWWVPSILVKPKELTGIFYAHELEPLLLERGVKKGLAKVRESYAVRPLTLDDVRALDASEDDKVLEVWREYFDKDDNLVILHRQLLAEDQMTGHTRSLVGEEMEGRNEW